MTLYRLKNFTVPASAGTKAQCDKEGHPWADRKGKCIRCGTLIRTLEFERCDDPPAKDQR